MLRSAVCAFGFLFVLVCLFTPPRRPNPHGDSADRPDITCPSRRRHRRYHPASAKPRSMHTSGNAACPQHNSRTGFFAGAAGTQRSAIPPASFGPTTPGHSGRRNPSHLPGGHPGHRIRAHSPATHFPRWLRDAPLCPAAPAPMPNLQACMERIIGPHFSQSVPAPWSRLARPAPSQDTQAPARLPPSSPAPRGLRVANPGSLVNQLTSSLCLPFLSGPCGCGGLVLVCVCLGLCGAGSPGVASTAAWKAVMRACHACLGNVLVPEGLCRSKRGSRNHNFQALKRCSGLFACTTASSAKAKACLMRPFRKAGGDWNPTYFCWRTV